MRVFILRGNVDCGCKERVGTIRALVQVDQHCRSMDNARKRESHDLCHRPVMTRLFCHHNAPNTTFRTRRNQSIVPLADHSSKYLSLALRSYSLIPSPLTKACDTHYPSSLSPSLEVPGSPLRLEWMKHLRTATDLAHMEYQASGRSTWAGKA